jgi:hypothetical protein
MRGIRVTGTDGIHKTYGVVDHFVNPEAAAAAYDMTIARPIPTSGRSMSRSAASTPSQFRVRPGRLRSCTQTSKMGCRGIEN